MSDVECDSLYLREKYDPERLGYGRKSPHEVQHVHRDEVEKDETEGLQNEVSCAPFARGRSAISADLNTVHQKVQSATPDTQHLGQPGQTVYANNK